MLLLTQHLLICMQNVEVLTCLAIFFNRTGDKDVVMWSAMIAAYALHGCIQNGHFSSALRLFSNMRREDILPNDFTLPCAFKASALLKLRCVGRQVHALSVKIGLISDVFVGCGAFDMYSKTGSIADAGKLFDEMPERNIVTWNAYISNAVLDGRPKGALQAFIEFVRMGGEPDGITLCAFLNACADTLNLVLGKQLHGFVMRNAGKLFDEMPERNIVTWNAYISNAVLDGRPKGALQAFIEFVWMGGEPDGITLCAFLNACADTLNLVLGKQLHGFVMRSGFESDVSVSNGLIDFYGKCKEVGLAEMVFDGMERRNLVTWGSMVATYEQNGEKEKACIAFMKCRKLGIEPTDYVISSVVSACAELAGIELGRQVHALSVKIGLISDVFVGCGAFDMYSKTGSIADAGKLFDEMPERNIVTWNAYISNAVLDGRPKGALQAFIEFVRMGGEPDGITLCAFLNACADTLNLVLGKQLHGFVMRSGFESDVSVSNGLIDFYGKCKEVGPAELILRLAPSHSVVTWTSLISGCVQNGHFSSALRLFSNMRREDILPNDFTLPCAFKASALLKLRFVGRQVHALSVKIGLISYVFVGCALVDMYGKCGSIHDAEQTFREMPEKNLFAWNAMISGYAHQGHADMAIGLFREMASVVAPNYVTFVCVLSACSRGGAVETGMDVYESMMKKYGIEAGPEHYACVVDMLARSGLVERAYDFVQKLPIRPTISIWGALLNACRVHGKPEIGKIAADNLFELDPKDSGNHVLLSNMFAVAGR
ncbi:Pentatricopeptide repeat-containing protein At4g14850 [Linum perenne]